MSTKPRGVGLMGFSFIVDAIVDSVPGVEWSNLSVSSSDEFL